jgi:hypothetical protein
MGVFYNKVQNTIKNNKKRQLPFRKTDAIGGLLKTLF